MEWIGSDLQSERQLDYSKREILENRFLNTQFFSAWKPPAVQSVSRFHLLYSLTSKVQIFQAYMGYQAYKKRRIYKRSNNNYSRHQKDNG